MTVSFQKRGLVDYKIATTVYQGPFDLLLKLIENAELDITKLALAQVTDQYLSHMRGMQAKNAEEVSAFLVIAAKLLQIKSEALLPRPPDRETGEEDPGEELAQQLREYRRYKEIANLLKERQVTGFRTYLRLAAPPKVEAQVDLSGYSVEDIWQAARSAMIEADNRQELGTVVAAPRVTVREKIGIIVKNLRAVGATSFKALLGNQLSRLEVVVTFLAILELVKRHYIKASQDSLFGEITLETSNGWEEEIDFELEFGE